jgi:hypothetical protein
MTAAACDAAVAVFVYTVARLTADVRHCIGRRLRIAQLNFRLLLLL